jgi:hypothetical protein
MFGTARAPFVFVRHFFRFTMGFGRFVAAAVVLENRFEP